MGAPAGPKTDAEVAACRELLRVAACYIRGADPWSSDPLDAANVPGEIEDARLTELMAFIADSIRAIDLQVTPR